MMALNCKLNSKNMLDPMTLHRDIVHDYIELISIFKEKVCRFKHLEEHGYYNSENMSIHCLNRDLYEDEEYYTFWWNHYQKNESHILNLSMSEGKWLISIQSSAYKIPDKSHSDLINTMPVEMYNNYISLYYADSWFSQLIEDVEDAS